MVDATDLYQEIIMDHTKSPRNYEHLADADHEAQGDNPLCGDELTVYIKLDDGKVTDVTFEADGCAISTASASVMTEAVEGRDIDDVEELVETFKNLVTGEEDANAIDPAELGDLAALRNVQNFPTRVKCATLSWHTLQAALNGRDEPVTTE
ncbi:SUF system NifU family Fe-S cluster assembly protein [Thermoplasmatales archaeon SW_10_69_26]|jgi:nitrogen fixation NifU-like protein|nr:MAG: SUF system NifU family Fe-S cluster assembly protein [Thermoplasmatales archaeon SW_10_69_26]